MRDYLFRGKRVDNKEWVVGDLIDKDYILQYIDLAESWTPLTSDHKVTCRAYEVIPETVGQLIGLSKMGENIYEGDIIKHGESIRFIEKRGSNYVATRMDRTATILLSFCESPIVIGNCFDNPELINQPNGGALNMNIDPNVKAEETQEQAATESASQDQAMEVDTEERGEE